MLGDKPFSIGQSQAERVAKLLMEGKDRVKRDYVSLLLAKEIGSYKIHAKSEVKN